MTATNLAEILKTTATNASTFAHRWTLDCNHTVNPRPALLACSALLCVRSTLAFNAGAR